MKIYPQALEELISQLKKLPGVGPKTAARLAFDLVRRPAAEGEALARAILRVKENLTLCSSCQNLTESDPCPLCRDPGRDSRLLCVVEFPADLAAIENCGAFSGRYFVLHGNLAPLQGSGPDELRLERLERRVRETEVVEIILATSPTVEGNTAALLISERLSPLGLRLTRPACGLPVGADLEYMDQVMIRKSLEGRGTI